MSSLKIYVKYNQEVKVSPKFVYCSSVYKIWNQGAGLLDETYYVSSKPLNLKKIPTKLKQKGYIIQRYIQLESAPENYLITKGYKLK